MAKFTGRPKVLPSATLDQFKYEVADELGLTADISARGWADMPSRDLGRIGGNIGGRIVRVMIKHAEQALADQHGRGTS